MKLFLKNDKLKKLTTEKTNAQKDVEKTKRLIKKDREYTKLVNSQYIESLSGHYNNALRERYNTKVNNENKISNVKCLENFPTKGTTQIKDEQEINATTNIEKVKKLIEEGKECQKLIRLRYIESSPDDYKKIFKKRHDIKVDNTDNKIEKKAQKILQKQQEENKQNKKEVLEKEENNKQNNKEEYEKDCL